MMRSDELYQRLLESGFSFPKHCKSIIIVMRHGKLAEVNVTYNVLKGGNFVVEGNAIKTETKRTRLFDPDKPIKCSCCERYFRPNA